MAIVSYRNAATADIAAGLNTKILRDIDGGALTALDALEQLLTAQVQLAGPHARLEQVAIVVGQHHRWRYTHRRPRMLNSDAPHILVTISLALH